MTAYEKPSMDIAGVEALLKNHYGKQVQEVSMVSGGNLSAVFFFKHEERPYVIRFNELKGAFETERFISELLASQGVPYPRMLALSKIGDLSYSISERMEGGMLADLTEEQRAGLIPDLIHQISVMNHVDVGSTTGFGWLDASGSGRYSSWQEYITLFYQEDQTGTFWEGWHDLFKTTCLEKDVFEECYARLMTFSGYNAPHRHFVHNDCHAWNTLSDGLKITGIIDANPVYGDFMIDISLAAGILPPAHNLIQAFRDYQEQQGIAFPNFNERLLGAYYYKGLDGLRFYAKMGRNRDYDAAKSFLLNLTN
ncbi:phosphotransferase family protein [Paenibacillus solisilvae]|uniref:Phosphotransferase family protein n=1 Tax=Paenibacillus solisilvae TaxID=2486751 RepID=A0ABW0VVC0_9BACL